MVKEAKRKTQKWAYFWERRWIFILFNITDFTGKWNSRKIAVIAQFRFSRGSVGVACSLQKDRKKVILKKTESINRQIKCYFTCIHIFVNRKRTCEEEMTTHKAIRKKVLCIMSPRSEFSCLPKGFSILNAVKTHPCVSCRSFQAKKKIRIFLQNFTGILSKILNHYSYYTNLRFTTQSIYNNYYWLAVFLFCLNFFQ